MKHASEWFLRTEWFLCTKGFILRRIFQFEQLSNAKLKVQYIIPSVYSIIWVNMKNCPLRLIRFLELIWLWTFVWFFVCIATTLLAPRSRWELVCENAYQWCAVLGFVHYKHQHVYPQITAGMVTYGAQWWGGPQNLRCHCWQPSRSCIFTARIKRVLRVEFLLKTESGYLRDAEVTWFTLANP